MEPAGPAVAGQSERSPFLSSLRRGSLVAAGVGFLALAIAGVVLPLLPTTPFLLLAASCFVRSSPRLYRWLLLNRAFGPYIEQWHRDRTIPKAAKLKAYFVVVLAFGSSIAIVDLIWLRVALLVLCGGLLAFLARLPTSRAKAPDELPGGP